MNKHTPNEPLFSADVHQHLLAVIADTIAGRPCTEEEIVTLVHQKHACRWSKKLIRDGVQSMVEGRRDIKFSI